MPIKQTITMTRSNLSHPFFVTNASVREYIQTNYISTGKILDIHRTEDATGSLTADNIIIYKDEASKDEFLADARITATTKDRKVHHNGFTITETVTYETLATYP